MSPDDATARSGAGNGDVSVEEPVRCEVEEVALVVPETDDPSLPAATFRAMFLGVTSCATLIFLNTFFTYRSQPLAVSASLMQIAAMPVGRFMARVFPTRDLRFLGFRFSMNPGPFNVKEHVIITIISNCGISFGSGDMGSITVMKAYYKQGLTFLCAFFIVLTTQLIGYGWAGILRRYLVDPVEMWWPANVAQVSLFRALHEKEPKSKGLTRIQFFLIFMVASFVYYALPGYLFPMLTFFSWVCLAWPHSVTAQQIGSGSNGLGLGALSLDWAGISAFRGSPLIAPFSTVVNVAVGFVMFVYVIVPLCYWKFNTFDARKFPMFSKDLFNGNGTKYDTGRILTRDFDLNVGAYESYGKLYLSPLYALSIGSGFARFTSTLVHVALFHGSDIWRQTRSTMKNVKLDIHIKLMRNYKQVPEWWFLPILGGSIALALSLTWIWPQDVQLPSWGMLFAFLFAFVITLPMGIIQATTNQQPGYDVIMQIIFGFMLPGKPIASLMFKIYGRITTAHALSFLSGLKLGHYMKIPPRAMFIAQLVGTMVAAITKLGVAWWMLESIENICDVEALPPDSPWTCPKYQVTYNASVLWGLIGPSRIFGHRGMYRNLVWLFLVGAILPVPIWALSRIFPEKKWIPLINIPVITLGFAGIPPATPTNIASWLVTGTVFNFFVFRYRKGWWQRYNYVLSTAFDAGTALMGVLLFFALQNAGVEFDWWGTSGGKGYDHCPLATCPTAPEIKVPGCPVF